MDKKKIDKDYVCRCKDFEKGTAIYCYRHHKESPYIHQDELRKKKRKEYENNK